MLLLVFVVKMVCISICRLIIQLRERLDDFVAALDGVRLVRFQIHREKEELIM